IGKDQPVGVTPGNQTLAFGSEPTVTTDGGDLWNQVSSDYLLDPPQVPEPAWKARGDATDVQTFPVVSDHRNGLKQVYYRDADNVFRGSDDEGDHFANYRIPQPFDFGFGNSTNADSVSSIVLHPSDPNTLYIGASCGEASSSLTTPCSAIVTASYTPGTGGS